MSNEAQFVPRGQYISGQETVRKESGSKPLGETLVTDAMRTQVDALRRQSREHATQDPNYNNTKDTPQEEALSDMTEEYTRTFLAARRAQRRESLPAAS